MPYTNISKLLALVFFINLSSSFLSAQNLSAVYKVKKAVQVQTDDGFDPGIKPLEFTGYFYKLGHRSISFLKPDYLQKYPQGKIEVSNPGRSDNNVFVYNVNMDSIIGINYFDTDSLIMRLTYYSNTSNNQTPQFFKYEPGYQNWKILPETKVIQGLTCQKARWITPDNKLQWEVWFCPEIPVEQNVSNTLGLPGLVVEGESFGANSTYSLVQYSLTDDIDSSIFWPELFNKPFANRGIIRNRNKIGD